MAFLDTALKVVRLVSALIWLLVGVLTLWGTWTVFRDLGPALQSLGGLTSGAGAPGVPRQLPGGLTPETLQQFLPRSGAPRP